MVAVRQNLPVLIEQHGEFDLRIVALGVDELLQTGHIARRQPARRRYRERCRQRSGLLLLTFEQQRFMALGQIEHEHAHHQRMHQRDADDQLTAQAAQPGNRLSARIFPKRLVHGCTTGRTAASKRSINALTTA